MRAPLSRLLWARLHAEDNYAALPRALILERSPREWDFAADPLWFTALKEFSGGTSDALLRALEEASSAHSSEFYRQFRQNDIEVLSHFYARGPQRNKRLLDSINATTMRIAQEQLDDLLLLARRLENI